MPASAVLLLYTTPNRVPAPAVFLPLLIHTKPNGVPASVGFLHVSVNPVEVVGDPDVHAGVGGLGAAHAPRGDARLRPRPPLGAALQGAAAVTLPP